MAELLSKTIGQVFTMDINNNQSEQGNESCSCEHEDCPGANRTYQEVEAFCEKKYGCPFPQETEFGEIQWLNVPYFSRPYVPMHLHGVPMLVVRELAEGEEAVYGKRLTIKQLSLLGINFDPYTHREKPEGASPQGRPIFLSEAPDGRYPISPKHTPASKKTREPSISTPKNKAVL